MDKIDDLGLDYRTWILNKSTDIECLPMCELVDRVKRHIEEKCSGPGYVYLRCDDIGMTAHAIETVLEYMACTEVPVCGGVIQSGHHGYTECSPEEFAELCRLRSAGKIVCVRE